MVNSKRGLSDFNGGDAGVGRPGGGFVVGNAEHGHVGVVGLIGQRGVGLAHGGRLERALRHQGGALELVTVAPPGKRPMSGPEFLRGARVEVGERMPEYGDA